MTDVLERLGYDISFLGDNTWAVNAAPALPGNVNAIELLPMIVADCAETGQEAGASLLEPAALSMARSAAIRPGQELSAEETDSLIAALMSSSQPTFTPDGLKTFSILNSNDLTKLLS